MAIFSLSQANLFFQFRMEAVLPNWCFQLEPFSSHDDWEKKGWKWAIKEPRCNLIASHSFTSGPFQWRKTALFSSCPNEESRMVLL